MDRQTDTVGHLAEHDNWHECHGRAGTRSDFAISPLIRGRRVIIFKDHGAEIDT